MLPYDQDHAELQYKPPGGVLKMGCRKAVILKRHTFQNFKQGIPAGPILAPVLFVHLPTSATMTGRQWPFFQRQGLILRHKDSGACLRGCLALCLRSIAAAKQSKDYLQQDCVRYFLPWLKRSVFLCRRRDTRRHKGMYSRQTMKDWMES